VAARATRIAGTHLLPAQDPAAAAVPSVVIAKAAGFAPVARRLVQLALASLHVTAVSVRYRTERELLIPLPAPGVAAPDLNLAPVWRPTAATI